MFPLPFVFARIQRLKMRSTILFFLVLNASVLWAQNSFSYRFHFGFPAAELTSIVATDSCYYVTGIIADSIPPFNTGNIFVKFSLDGQVLIAKTLKDTLKTYETWRGNLEVISPGKLAVSGYAKDSTRKALLLVFNVRFEGFYVNRLGRYTEGLSSRKL